jgi:hypothetical protein
MFLNNSGLYKYGVEFSLSWIKSIGYKEIPEFLNVELIKLTCEMEAYITSFQLHVRNILLDRKLYLDKRIDYLYKNKERICINLDTLTKYETECQTCLIEVSEIDLHLSHLTIKE